MTTRLKWVAGICGSITVIVGFLGFFRDGAQDFLGVDALSAEVARVELTGTAGRAELAERLEQKIDSDRMATLDKQMWEMEERYRPRFKAEYGRVPKDTDELVEYMSADDRKRYRAWEKEYKALDEKAKERAKKEHES